MKKLKERWGIESNLQIVLILIVFAVTGSTASYIGKPILSFLDITPESFSTFGYWVVRILILFIMYQFLLVFFGWVFGQFKFFWAFEKKMLSRLGLGRFVE
ncbi:hypothetical protein SAMN05421824_2468 [Hyunsoonleella jejuensis]|uniref:DUF6787 domain-containing protein n=1 Tax=Hyunsoonleella jejuensis TaxID=419940 RepID=A0A1H9JCJ2_9FLAO|nr:DUF6787 family protein [Hyunsoonleella jejuensis]SEQ84556.1 hypothetical protein SAMN05421824_2468 [Hyunsoonleella jejuensis]